MDISVILCTWNNADRLNITLNSLFSLEPVDNCKWEIVIINNNCTDHTDDVVCSFTDHLPVKYIYEFF